MGDLSLNLLKLFTENCKTYSHLDNFNNIYYSFLLSGVAIESGPGQQLNKKYFPAN